MEQDIETRTLWRMGQNGVWEKRPFCLPQGYKDWGPLVSRVASSKSFPKGTEDKFHPVKESCPIRQLIAVGYRGSESECEPKWKEGGSGEAKQSHSLRHAIYPGRVWWGEAKPCVTLCNLSTLLLTQCVLTIGRNEPPSILGTNEFLGSKKKWSVEPFRYYSVFALPQVFEFFQTSQNAFGQDLLSFVYTFLETCM